MFHFIPFKFHQKTSSDLADTSNIFAPLAVLEDKCDQTSSIGFGTKAEASAKTGDENLMKNKQISNLHKDKDQSNMKVKLQKHLDMSPTSSSSKVEWTINHKN